MNTDFLIYILYTYLFVQFIFFGPVLFFLANILFKKYLNIRTFSTGLILPFCIFYAKDFELNVTGHNKTDIVNLKVKKIFFWINPFFLFIGKVRIHKFQLIEPNMNYLNRIPSIQKIKYMPKIGKVKIISGEIKKGIIEIEDRTVFPLYFVKIDEIDLEDSNIDLGIPLKLIFETGFGYCKIDSGEILTSCENGIGSLQVQGVTWGKLINLDAIPIGFLKNKIDMDISYSHDGTISVFEGTLGQINRDPLKQEVVVEKKKINFKFQADWNEYQLPFDLALKKMVYKIFTGVNIGGAFSLTVTAIADGISKLLKKL